MPHLVMGIKNPTLYNLPDGIICFGIFNNYMPVKSLLEYVENEAAHLLL